MMKNWTPSDWIVFILTVGIVVFLIVLSIKLAFSSAGESNEGRVEILKNILSYILGIISAYALSKKEK